MSAEVLGEEAVSLPFLNGVYVAVDAIAGAYLIVDGPYCVFTKAEMQYCHNLKCRLLPPIGPRRVVHTGRMQSEEVRSLSGDRTAFVERVFDDVCSRPDARIVLSTSFDFHELSGFPLRELSARRAKARGPLLCHVPSRSLGGSWLDGYALTCAALAKAVTLRPGKGSRDAVALVGYLRDRDEPDHAGNLRELKRLLRALGLRVSSVWLGGGGRASLEAARDAGLVVSLPYAREAARTVAARLEAELCEVDLPLGLAATERFLLEIGDRTGRRERARRLVDREAAAAVRETQAHALRLIAGRSFAVRQGDPELEARLSGFCAEVGLTAAGAGDAAADEDLVIFAPTISTPARRGVAFVPFGYPNYLDHPVVERPFLGYAGFRCLVERVAAAVLQAEAGGRR